MSQPVRFRMLDKLTGVFDDLARVDESLIEQHGLGVLDGFSHKFLIQQAPKKKSWLGQFLR